MPLGAVRNGLFFRAFATRLVCAAGSVRTSCGVHPVYSPCPARGVSEVSAVCGSLVVASAWKLQGGLLWMELWLRLWRSSPASSE